MRVLLLGGTGLIGRRLAELLLDAGHAVVLGVRERSRVPAGMEAVEVDFARDHAAGDWLPRLDDIDAVVNAVGIIAPAPGQGFESIHVRAPLALFEACRQARVGRVVQLSAIGADEQAQSDYHRSKHQADQALLASGLSAVVVQPSLVFSSEGASTRLFSTLAAMPLVPVPGDGRQQVQPVHLDDLCALVLACLEHPAPPARVEAVGPEPLQLRDYLLRLRALLGLGRAPVLPVPRPLVQLGARLPGLLPGPPVDAQMLDMLERGACGDPEAMTELTGRAPRPVEEFAPQGLQALALQARLDWLLPLMRVSLALMWIVTGVLSFGIYPVEDSLQMLARAGLGGGLALAALYSAAAMDLGFGVAMLALRRRLWLYRAQLALISAYTLVITVRLPEYWLHPFGPVLKNIPVIAMIIVLHELERGRRWNT